MDIKTNGGSRKCALLLALGCAVLLAFADDAKANRVAMPPVNPSSVPDGGSTVVLLGAALGALTMVRRLIG
jgi:VPDSG-CTERM motif